ncbi:hypothetical protein CV770_30600 [Bradyrhizobium sp. AC87j1]|uniref:hypothetical protein n=1 Tax=Bradyrhizobium sp. AC87j1 TaxID=2055894 RepID=UPI000CEC0698|nr:hypothetical protein [Bradyrhizobium sp. AC87j1]PPQ15578.1 hypothetical protein CV770_30600 [Bradyrhizobium sp. AC87j1]
MQRRRRFKQTKSLEERLAEEAKELHTVAATLPPGPTRDAVLRKARQDETAAHMTEWLNSPGLKPPT